MTCFSVYALWQLFFDSSTANFSQFDVEMYDDLARGT